MGISGEEKEKNVGGTKECWRNLFKEMGMSGIQSRRGSFESRGCPQMTADGHLSPQEG